MSALCSLARSLTRCSRYATGPPSWKTRGIMGPNVCLPPIGGLDLWFGGEGGVSNLPSAKARGFQYHCTPIAGLMCTSTGWGANNLRRIQRAGKRKRHHEALVPLHKEACYVPCLSCTQIPCPERTSAALKRQVLADTTNVPPSLSSSTSFWKTLLMISPNLCDMCQTRRGMRLAFPGRAKSLKL